MSKIKPEHQEKRDKKWASIGILQRKNYELLKKRTASCGIPMHRLIMAYVYMAKDSPDIDILQADYDFRNSEEGDA